jgi:predicted Zn-dependent peptidase
MKHPYQKTVLANGVRVVSHAMKERGSAAIGIWVDAGGRQEDLHYKGAAHFLEHIVFKGSEKYSCAEIKGNIEGVGGSLNAFTGEEMTCYYAKIPARHLSKTMDILTDMTLRPQMASHEIEKERGVIIEEIKMYHDLPQYFVMELLDELMWPNHPLGVNLAGSAETVNRIDRAVLKKFHRQYYSARHVVVSACGAVNHRSLVKFAQAHLGRLDAHEVPPYLPARNIPDHAELKTLLKPIEQMHLAMGFPGFPDQHKDRYVLNMLHIILGGNMSSRLFHEVREKRGLAYSISTSVKYLHDTGLFLIRAGVDNRKLIEAVSIVLKELKRITRQGLTKTEFQRALEYYRGQVLLGLEDTLDHMFWIGEALISRDELRSLPQVLASINRVTIEDIQRVAQAVLRPDRLRLAVVGPVNEAVKRGLKKCLDAES